MNVINLRMSQVRKLKELELEKGTLNTEALMLILNKKITKENEPMVFKYLDSQDDLKIMGRKMYTLNMLSGSEYSKIKELVIPNTMVVVDGKVAGFAMPLIYNHKNLGIFLNDDLNDLKKKLEYIKKVGKIIDKVGRIDTESFIMNFGDLNEFNFVIDENDNIKAIDLDSAYVGQDELPNSAYYLLKNKYLESMPEKYKKNRIGTIMPDNNTDLYCFNMILLNTLANESMHSKDLDTFYRYLFYLKDMGIDKEILKVFKSIYLPMKNQNPMCLLETIDTTKKDDYTYESFKKEYKIK